MEQFGKTAVLQASPINTGSVSGAVNGGSMILLSSMPVSSVLWDIDASGNVAGTGTTGCTYSGTLALDASAPAILDVAITESCAGKLQA